MRTSIRSICGGWVTRGSYTGSFAAVRSSVSSTLLPILHPLHFVVIWQRPCPIKISLKVSERDKLKMHENYQSAWHKQVEEQETCWDDLDPSEKLPPLKHSETDTDGWEDFDTPVLYFYGGLMPYVGRYVSLPTFISGVSLPSPHLLSGTCSSGRWYCRTTA